LSVPTHHSEKNRIAFLLEKDAGGKAKNCAFLRSIVFKRKYNTVLKRRLRIGAEKPAE
jgi:hypothetical protein